MSDTSTGLITPRAPTQPPEAAKTPVGPGAVSFVGALLAIAVIGVGAIGLQTAASAAGMTQAEPWLTRMITGADGLLPLGWMLPAGILVALAGLWLLVAALRPRPRTAVALEAQTGVFLRPRDLARLAEHAANDVDGVAAVRAKASRAKVGVWVDSTGGADVADAVKAAVDAQFAALKKKPRVRVKTKEVAP